MTMHATLQFCDSFGHYDQAQVSQKWYPGGVNNVTLVSARGGRNGVFLVGGFGTDRSGITKIITLPVGMIYNVWMIGFAMMYTGQLGATIYTASSTANNTYNPIEIIILPDSNLGLQSGNVQLSLGLPPLYANTWYYVELQYAIGGTSGHPIAIAGYAALNGQSVAYNLTSSIMTPSTGVGIDTHTWSAGDNQFTGVTIGDVYIAILGSMSTSYFYGDVKINYYMPVSSDPGNQWTGNYTDINSNPTNDLLFIETNVLGQISFFGFQQITGSPTYLSGLAIQAVQSTFRTRFFDASESVVPLIGSFKSYGSGYQFKESNAAFIWYTMPWDVDPVSTFVWSYGLFNNYEYGISEYTT